MNRAVNQYQMRVNQINPAIFRLKLVKIDSWKENVVFETISSTIPSTRELIGYYKQIALKP
jgi:hypothetical protein